MTRAWNIYRGKYHYSDSFAECLRRAWEVEKANVIYNARKAAEEAERKRLEQVRKESASKPVVDVCTPEKIAFMERLYGNWAYSGD